MIKIYALLGVAALLAIVSSVLAEGGDEKDVDEFIKKQLAELKVEMEKLETSIIGSSIDSSSHVEGSDDTDDGISYGTEQSVGSSQRLSKAELSEKIHKFKEDVAYKYEEFLWFVTAIPLMG